MENEMFISSPLSNLKELKYLINAGADEFYCGLISGKNPSGLYLNRRPSTVANFRNLSDLRKVINLCKKNKKKISIAFNEKFYTNEQEKTILKGIDVLIKYKIDSLILANIDLILKVRKKHQNVNITASCVSHVLNNKSVKFYNKLGVNEITLPLDLNISEVQSLAENNKNVKFTCFVLDMGCRNINGLCSYFHYPRTARRWLVTPCHSNRFISAKKSIDIAKLRENNSLNVYNCGLCKIYDYSKSGINSLKIVGRLSPTTDKTHNIRILYELREFLHSSPSRKEFNDRCKSLYRLRFKTKCDFNCVEMLDE